MTQPRIHYLDWLKVLIVYGIVVFHVSLVFSFVSWLVSNPERSVVLSAFAGFCFPWGLSAMFLIAGADALFGLRSHGVAEFVKGRVERLLVPVVLGLVVLTPFQRFVTSHNPPPSLDQFGSFYVAFFESFHLDMQLKWIATYLLHLWFLVYLFAISLACSPLLLWLHRARGKAFSAQVARVGNLPGGMYLVGAPLLVSQAILRPLFPTFQDWADVAMYTLVFLLGALMFSTRRFEPAIRRDIRLFLTTGVLAIAGIGLILLLTPGYVPPGRWAPFGLGITYGFLWALDVWSWLLAVLYLGIRWLDFTNSFLTYARESVMPVYVLHHPVLLVIASFVVTASAGVWPKFVLVLAATFALTLAIYELGVRRWNVTRFLFGLKPVAREAGDHATRRVAA